MTVDLFQQGLPAENSPIQSAPIRTNFAALYDKLRTLEAQATSPVSTAILVQGGPVYFRAGTSVLLDPLGNPISGKLQYINFQTTIIDLSQANGYKTIKNPDGSLTRQAIFNGISPFTSVGLYREILIALNSQGKLSFTEGDTTTTGLSKPFDIAFDDSEIPICLVTVQQGGTLGKSGQLQSIQQININDVRPFVTTAFQNNLTAASLQSAVTDTQNRVAVLESTISTTDALKVRIPPVEKLTIDGTLTTNIKLEVLSGSTYINSKLVRYSGGYVNANQDLTSPIPVDDFNSAVVTLQDDGTIVLVHGSPSDANSQRELVLLPLAVDDGYIQTNNPSMRNGILHPPSNAVALAIIYYRAVSTPSLGTTTSIKPVVSTTFVDPIFGGTGGTQVVGGVRFSYELPIIAINSPTEFVVQIPSDVDSTIIYLVGQFVDLRDDNTRPFRRTVSQRVVDNSSSTITVTVSDTFVNDVSSPGTTEGISLKRNPVAVSVSQNQLVLEDVRPFVSR